MPRSALTRLVACSIVGLMALAAPAGASTVSVEDGVLVYEAAPGETNDTAIYRAFDPTYNTELPNTVSIYTVDDLSLGVGCAPVPEAGVLYAFVAYQCTGVTDGMVARLGDGNDYFEGETPGDAPITVEAGAGDDFVGLYNSDDVIDGGEGDDFLYGGHGNDSVKGGAGDDELQGDFGGFADGEDVAEDLEGAGNDVLDGGPGRDRLGGNGGTDVLNGGDGDDVALYNARKTPIQVSFDGQANDGAENENDTVGADVEGVLTGVGDDTVRGGAGPDNIGTGLGKDTIDPGAGEDVVDSGTGNDSIAARDGAVDHLSCGDGADSAVIDAADVGGSDCEQLDRPGGTSAPGTPASGGPLTGTLKLRAAKARRGTVRVTGQLALPAGADTRLCTGAAVKVKVTTKRGGKRRSRTLQTTLGADCRFASALGVKVGRGRTTATGSLVGTNFLVAVRSKSLRLRRR